MILAVIEADRFRRRDLSVFLANFFERLPQWHKKSFRQRARRDLHRFVRDPQRGGFGKFLTRQIKSDAQSAPPLLTSRLRTHSKPNAKVSQRKSSSDPPQSILCWNAPRIANHSNPGSINRSPLSDHLRFVELYCYPMVPAEMSSYDFDYNAESCL